VANAAKIAKAKGLKTLAFTGAALCALDALCDVTVKVPETETFKAQELHLPVYHYLCAALEMRVFGGYSRSA
jgi:phosphoheptose isomerase